MNTTFTPETLVNTTESGLRITVVPVDAAQLNVITYAAATRDGGYEREYVTTSRTRMDQLEALPRNERRKIEDMNAATQRMEEAIRGGQVGDVELARMTLDRLWGSQDGKDGSEVDFISGNLGSPAFNPYQMNEAYLSVFRVEMENASDQVITLENGDLQVAHGMELLYPLTTDFFEEVLPKPSPQLTNVLRMNLPTTVTLPPGTTVAKYIAIPAIGSDASNLTVQYVKGDEAVPFDFQVRTVAEESSVTLVPVQFQARRKTPLQAYAVRIGENAVHAIKDDVLYVREDQMGSPIDVCVLQVTGKDAAYFGCEENVMLRGQQSVHVSAERVR